MNNSHTCGQPDTHKNKELCNAEAHTEGRRQDGVVEHTFTQPCKYRHTCSFTTASLPFSARMCVCVCVWGGVSYVICGPSIAALLYGVAWSDPVSPESVCVSPSPCILGIRGKLRPLIRFLYICSISSPFLCFIPPHLPVLSSSFLLHSL